MNFCLSRQVKLFPKDKVKLSKDLFIKIRTRTVVKLLLILYKFLCISLYLRAYVFDFHHQREIKKYRV